MHDQAIHAEVNLKFTHVYVCIYVCTYEYAYTTCAFRYYLPYLFNISSKICAEAFKVMEESVYT
jgi:hypothetical protein